MDTRIWGLTNGLYKLTVNVADDPPETTQISVGELSVAVTNAGEYVFLLKKCTDYPISVFPEAATNFVYSAMDDIAPRSLMFGMAGINDGWWTTDRQGLKLVPPMYPMTLFTPRSHVLWIPTLQISPSTWQPSSFSDTEIFTAIIGDIPRADWSMPLYFNPATVSASHPGVLIKARWRPEAGAEVTASKRLTIVSPVAEPVCSATLSESGVTNLSVLASVSIVEVKMLADVVAPSNSCARRHMYGVHEKVNVEVLPLESEVGLSFVGGDGFSYYDSDCFWCPWTGGVYSVSFVSGNAALPSSVNVFDPIPLVVDAWWNGVEGTNGIAGTVVMNMELLLAPLTVSFMSIWVVEIPDETEGCPHFGYFDNPIYGRPWSHTTEAGAGEWFLVTQRNEWTHDRAGTAKVYPAPWSSGWKEWDIPIGWSDRIGEIKGRSRPNSEIERFEIDQSGAVTIRKFGHWIKRAPNNRVWVDGRCVN